MMFGSLAQTSRAGRLSVAWMYEFQWRLCASDLLFRIGVEFCKRLAGVDEFGQIGIRLAPQFGRGRKFVRSRLGISSMLRHESQCVMRTGIVGRSLIHRVGKLAR